MRTNTYTLALDDIHVSEEAVERAIRAAKQRARKTIAMQTKTRYAAAAASIVLASAAGVSLFYQLGNSPVSVKVAVQATESTKMSESYTPVTATSAAAVNAEPSSSETITETVLQEETAPQSPAAEAPAETVSHIVETQHEGSDPTEKSEVPTTAPFMPTEPPTQAPSTELTVPYELADSVDPSLLCADGKLYMAIAETGLTHIDDPAALSDEYLYCIETKFGRYYPPKPFELKPFIPTWVDQPKSDVTVYLYNSDGEIVAQAPAWW